MSDKKEQIQWNIFYRKMSEGKIPHRQKYYDIDNYVSNEEVEAEYEKEGNINPEYKLISYTDQQLEQAKAQVKLKLEEKLLNKQTYPEREGAYYTTKKRKTAYF